MDNQNEMRWDAATRTLHGDTQEIEDNPWSEGQGVVIVVEPSGKAMSEGVKTMAPWRRRKDGICTGQVYAAGRGNRSAMAVTGKSAGGALLDFIMVKVQQGEIIPKRSAVTPPPVAMKPSAVIPLAERPYKTGFVWRGPKFQAPYPLRLTHWEEDCERYRRLLIPFALKKHGAINLGFSKVIPEWGSGPNQAAYRIWDCATPSDYVRVPEHLLIDAQVYCDFPPSMDGIDEPEVIPGSFAWADCDV